jgi:hypothetical protein
MNRQDYLDLINAPGINHVSVEWQTTVTPAAKHRGTDLRKVTKALVMTGAEFSGLAENSDRDTGELPWGQWAAYPYVIAHKGNDYYRLYTVDNTIKSIYLVNGEVVDWATFSGYLTPSQAAGKRPVGGCITVKAENLRLVGEVTLTH